MANNMSDLNAPMDAQSLAYVEGIYQTYLNDPSAVSPQWRAYFEQNSDAQHNLPPGTQIHPTFKPASVFNARNKNSSYNPAPLGHRGQSDDRVLQDRVNQLIRNYRVRGHICATVNPLQTEIETLPELSPAYYGLTDADMASVISTTGMQGPDKQTLGKIIQRMNNTYCRSISVQYMHIDDISIREWLQRRMEGTENKLPLNKEEQIRILTKLTDATLLEEFIHKKYLGAKRFSLEGAESLIPLLDLAMESAGQHHIEEVVIGMAHRGRLNVLANIAGKSPYQIFREFEDHPEDKKGSGDVKYHMGYTNNWKTLAGKTIQLALCFNPSHLEYVNPVAMGRVRARQVRAADKKHDHSMAILIHGDAAVIGEGVVQESLNLSQLRGYRTGGTLHIVVNNQIGFTTSPDESRSSRYATDIFKMLAIPIFHVNGEDPDAVAQAIRLAMDFRKQFKRDVVIDMYCYRRYGHNEGDEPKFTHPQLYSKIDARKSVREGYLQHLLAMGDVTRSEADVIAEQREQRLEDALAKARGQKQADKPVAKRSGIWSQYFGGPESSAKDVDTGVPVQTLAQILTRITTLPQGFTPHPKIKRILNQRSQMAQGKRPLDWAAAEALAFATLLIEGTPIRLSGQDARRGTFSHRHAAIYDVATSIRERIIPLNHLQKDQAKFDVRNSALSENGVLGFDYGYSLDMPDSLVIWEAQFGDFANSAQVIIDQFIASAEDKWGRLSGLVMLLPHGFEGQGPEHSSARLERYLTLCAEDNMQVIYASTPAQYYHALRRQMRRKWRKPMIMMSPKSGLRNPQTVSSLQDCATGTFKRVIEDPKCKINAKTKRVILCTGKIYYDLIAHREELARDDISVVRIEQLYPIPTEQICQILKKAHPKTSVVWVQEEPENMGAWRFLLSTLPRPLCGHFDLQCIARKASASPATGSNAKHKQEQKQLMEKAFAVEK